MTRYFVNPFSPPLPVRRPVRGTVFFLHIPKTAGTSVLEAMARFYRPDAVFPYHGEEALVQHDPQYVRRRYRLVAAHAGFRIANVVGDHIVTVLRDPVDRILSLYNYWHAAPEQKLVSRFTQKIDPAVVMAKNLDFATFLDCRLRRVRADLDNAQAWQVAHSNFGAARDEIGPIDDAELYSRAAKALASMDVIGTTDDLARFGAGIERSLGLPVRIGRANVTARKSTARDRLAPEVIAKIDRLTSVDRALYEDIRAGRIRPSPRRLRARWRRLGPMIG
ncbi:MAG: sulfotransferase family 2 domain-containing protein [Paracoccaceae bacterium]